jgi:serpin B
MLRLRDLRPASGHDGNKRLRGMGAALIAVVVAGACGTAAATPAASNGPTATPWPSSTPWPSLTTEPTPPASEGPTPFTTQLPGSDFAVALGKAGLLAPASDSGSLAGTEINDFGLDLLRRLGSTGNLCASPASIALALAMVRPGALGLTATEMDKVLHEFGSPGQAAEIVALLRAFEDQTIYDDSGWSSNDAQATPDHTGQQPIAELDVSNAAFAQKGMSLEPAYLDALSSGFGAGLGLLDYQNDPEGARQVINKWASDLTKGRIPAILQPGDVTSMTRIALANAIYLKAAWVTPFDPSDTKSLPFTRGNGSAVSVPTMAGERILSYAAGAGYRAVMLPMGAGGLSMTIVVPDNMASYVSGLTAAGLASLDDKAKRYDIDLTLPRFSAETRTDLASILAAMGMPTLFDPNGADLSGITTAQQLYIAQVIHQANIDVVEEGTTASAVTVALGMATGAGPEELPHLQFHVNKPFLYFIREQSTGTVLFMGRIDDPSAKS